MGRKQKKKNGIYGKPNECRKHCVRKGKQITMKVLFFAYHEPYPVKKKNGGTKLEDENPHSYDRIDRGIPYESREQEIGKNTGKNNYYLQEIFFLRYFSHGLVWGHNQLN